MSDALKAAIYVRGVLLPLDGAQLLLPNAAVSEVVSYHEPDVTFSQAPGWLLGSQVWREQVVPLISFERLVGRKLPRLTDRSRVAICNTLNGSTDLPYIGIVLQAIPHLVRVSEVNIAPVEEPQDIGKLVLQQVKVENEEAWIPDLDAVEQMVQAMIS